MNISKEVTIIKHYTKHITSTLYPLIRLDYDIRLIVGGEIVVNYTANGHFLFLKNDSLLKPSEKNATYKVSNIRKTYDDSIIIECCGEKNHNIIVTFDRYQNLQLGI